MAIAIRLEILADGPRSGTEQIAASVLTSELDRSFKPGNEALTLDWSLTEVARIVALTAKLRGEVKFACSRCSDPLTLPLNVDIAHHWVPAGELEVDGASTTDFDRDPDVSEHDGFEIDIEPIVMECVLVDFPFAPACDLSLEGCCPDWTEDPRILHPGGEAPDIELKIPFASLADLYLTPDAEA